jgi:aryl-alcohol dehydrogenase-like predicted oxidoreductase
VQYRKLGRSGLTVSRLCLGTMNFGWLTDEAESFAIMDRALDEGVNFFDTADAYGGAIDEHKYGVTEELIGRWLSQGGGRREKVVLGTKLFYEVDPWPNGGGLSARHIRQACDASLKRLQTDYLDLYQMHHIDRSTPWDEIWEAMEVLRAQGKIIYNGSSNFGGWHIAQAQERASARNYFGLVSEQSIYNLLTRDIELEVIPAAENYGLGVLPWSPLAGGLLGGFIRKDRGLRRTTDIITLAGVDASRAQLTRYEDLCDEIEQEPGVTALAWLLSRPAVVAPVIGPRTMEQFEGSLRALDVVLEDKTLAQLDEIFPGRQTAPEDYAW